jgi:hypothetical protein
VQIVIDDEPSAIATLAHDRQRRRHSDAGADQRRSQAAEAADQSWLREATAWAMLHTAGLDSAAPPWVVAAPPPMPAGKARARSRLRR